MRTILLSIAYFLTGLIFIILEDHSSQTAQLLLKSLIIPWLIVIFCLNLGPFRSRFNTLIFVGLIFSWAGDIVLRFSFMPGLLLFLMAHISYLTSFFLTPGKNVIFTNRIYLLIPVLLYGFGLCYYLYGDLGEMRIPVITYAFVILAMLAGAINRLKKVNIRSYWLVLTGALLFVISDSAIAVNKFSRDFNYSNAVIMSTYIAAQYLITIGYIRHVRDKYL